MLWTYFINDLNGEEITFYEKELEKSNQKEFRIEKLMKINYMLNGKVTINHLIAGLIKAMLYKNGTILS